VQVASVWLSWQSLPGCVHALGWQPQEATSFVTVQLSSAWHVCVVTHCAQPPSTFSHVTIPFDMHVDAPAVHASMHVELSALVAVSGVSASADVSEPWSAAGPSDVPVSPRGAMASCDTEPSDDPPSESPPSGFSDMPLSRAEPSQRKQSVSV
jgi:hypothetical protein